ncbi:unnamed protein product [Symbiodinium natans]|uniref:U-box domain-containing protein n=1 Tax=Symbiodinium natans TaxID=878477 RepID=A0A812NGJ0_9DINO|nr:unnamed protein product [Symbiodinium natans]
MHRAQHLTAQAVEFIEEVASADLADAVGDLCTQHLLAKVNAVYGALGGANSEALAEAVEDLARDCATLPEWVDRDFEQEYTAEEEEEDYSWAFGPAVAEACAAAAAAVAGLAEPGLIDDAPELAMTALEAFALDLDCLTPYIYAGLCRTEKLRMHTPEGRRAADARDRRVGRSLQAVASWMIAALGRNVGYENLTPLVLWDLAGGDALWALVLARGALALPQHSGRAKALEAPEEIELLHQTVALAVLGLHTAAVAFATEEGADGDGAPNIATRSAQLAKHRATLAAEVTTCHLLPSLVQAADKFLLQPQLAHFLASILQAEIIEENPAWAQREEAALDAARGAAASLAEVLSDAWPCFAQAQVLPGPTLRSFLCDAGDLAFASDVALATTEGQTLASIVQLLGCSLQSMKAPDKADHLETTWAACVALAANALILPGETSAADLEAALGNTQQAEVAQQLRTWPRPLRTAAKQRWLQFLEPRAAPAPLALELRNRAAPGSAAALQSGGLRQILQDAPRELRCALDGRLMMDPVRAPLGFLYERSVLAEYLVRSGGLCPLTGNALALENCPRDSETRRKVQRWIREHKASTGCSRRRLSKPVEDTEPNYSTFFGE